MPDVHTGAAFCTVYRQPLLYIHIYYHICTANKSMQCPVCNAVIKFSQERVRPAAAGREKGGKSVSHKFFLYVIVYKKQGRKTLNKICFYGFSGEIFVINDENRGFFLTSVYGKWYNALRGKGWKIPPYYPQKKKRQK